MRSLANAGLVWARYLGIWSRGVVPDRLDGEESRNVLRVFAEDFTARTKSDKPSPNHPRTLLERVHARQERVLRRCPGPRKGGKLQAELKSRLAVGLGTPHPTENGFTFDRTVGVPYLPGSSLKGLARAAAKFDGVANREELFGPDRIDQEGDGFVGDLVFLDGYPSAWPSLKVDIVNCHHSKYYAGAAPYPAETDSPVPVYFLTVDAGTPFCFRLMSRSGKHVEVGLRLLETGLKELGAGAKTAVGYGELAASSGVPRE